jgi:UPF0755 protein
VKRLVWIIVLVILVGGGWLWFSMRPTDASSVEQVAVTIEKGDSVGRIAAKLWEQGLIRSPFVFKLYAKLTGNAGELKAGTFILKRSQSLSEIFGIIHGGVSNEMFITVPEGYTVADIDKLLASKGLGNQGDILDCAFKCDFSSFEFLPAKAASDRAHGYGSRLEGYLFPETYAANISEYVPKFFLERMLGEFRERIVEEHTGEIQGSGHTLHEIVTMASLIEEESRHDDEREVISGILWKRLKNGVVLGVDAVNRYALGKKTDALTKADLEADSPYNSRRRQGLPPSPIANPGESAIEAALNPKDSEYWYYLHGSGGQVHYAVTDEQHIANKAKYLR